MGSEFGQESEWAESRSLDWWLTDNPDHRGVQTLVADLNRVYGESPSLWTRDADPAGFQWIDANDASNNVFSFLRHGDDGSVLACIANFSAVPHEGYRVGLPHPGRWDEVLNTDAESYSGSGVGNLGAIEAGGTPWHGQPASATLRVPPLGTVWLRRRD
jgi:1,4-alpha-glucan branching enzyme